ncbi:hypothetical protein A1O3_07873 [Capronia epimyces CBS 606.96]|uniref:GH16 domain-containing protein n=1 Tax=Capronia epimyces CBS 606.96 TaxID=1182542 RepID=W9YB41_9EURO|nr:uncharacterized protein A1O3_07873 [Capronia epimyces CBS 606.96]EXJ79594.1 hypothetical protein A1O3_07873 [Capronia epimyces CBS 606.96]
MALSTSLATVLLTSAALWSLASADTCNPLSSPCPAIPGLASSTYSVSFAQQTTTPTDWILADFATVNYGAPNGANFTIAKRYDAPYIWSRFYVLFGRIEVVLKAAPGAGIITGAVMMSDDLDEIDWEWSGNNFAGASGKVQTNFFGKGITGYYDRGSTPAVTAPQDQFHTYALDWSPAALTWSIDGQNVRTLKNSLATSGEYQYPQTPSRLHLGVWCAGDPDNNGATVAWGGGYTNFSLAPFSAYVQSVKITTPNPCSSWQYPSSFDGTYSSVLCTNQTVTNTLPCTYAVVQGDDGYKIAKTLGITFEALQAANANVNWDALLLRIRRHRGLFNYLFDHLDFDYFDYFDDFDDFDSGDFRRLVFIKHHTNQLELNLPNISCDGHVKLKYSPPLKHQSQQHRVRVRGSFELCHL